MIIKTNELTGAALDWAVAKCEGKDAIVRAPHKYVFEPSINWSQAGPIIEREKIAIGYYAQNTARGLGVYASRAKLLDKKGSCFMYGSTPLIAAMRCYVASKLGDEVDVPADLALDCLIYETGEE